jgi:hypothetical protein
MSKEQRKAPRRRVDAAGFLFSRDGQPLGECRMKDVSTGGARLAHAIDGELPDQLLLSLSKNAAVRRLCRIAWRRDKEMGVRFLLADSA